MLNKQKNIINSIFYKTAIIFAILICSSIYIIAQDSTYKKNKIFFLETQIYPSYNNDTYQPQVKFRVQLNNNSILRSNTNFYRTSKKDEILENGGDGLGSVEKISSLFSFSLGYEYFKKFNKVSIYSGFEGFIGFGREDEYGSRTDSVTYIADRNYNIKRPIQQFGIRLFSGADIFINSNLYIGTEFGLLLLKTDYKNGSSTVENVSSITDPVVTSISPSSSNSIILYSGLGVIRVGWRF
jgi:hypothetical protein